MSESGELQPNHLLVRLTDDTLFQCPFVMMTEVGSVYFDEREAARLREYLLKGGFLSQIRKVFPSGDFRDRHRPVLVDALTRDDPFRRQG